MSDTALYPRHKEALQRLRDDGLSYGRQYLHEWFADAFGIVFYEGVKEATKRDELRNKYYSLIHALIRDLEIEERLTLRSVHGLGYEIVSPKEQTEWAVASASDGVTQVLRKAARRVSHIRTEELTNEQRAANRDARAKLAAMASLAGSLPHQLGAEGVKRLE